MGVDQLMSLVESLLASPPSGDALRGVLFSTEHLPARASAEHPHYVAETTERMLVALGSCHDTTTQAARDK